MTPAVALLSRVVQDTPRELNDDIVRPGWIGFVVFLALVVASYLLFRSMNRHLKKVDFEEAPATPAEPTDHGDAATPDADPRPDPRPDPRRS